MRFLIWSSALFVLEMVERVGGERVKAAAHSVDAGEGQRARVCAVGEQNKDTFGCRVNPATCACESEMAEAVGRKITSGG